MKQTIDLQKMDLHLLSNSDLSIINGGGFWKIFGVVMEAIGTAMIAASLIFTLGGAVAILGLATAAAGFIIEKDSDIIF